MRIGTGGAVMAGLLAAAGPAHAGDCPSLVRQATQLILVVTPAMDRTEATIATFSRRSRKQKWTQQSGPEPAVAGLKGLAWGYPYRGIAKPGEPLKAEGDKRAPAGFYKLGPTFGFEPSSRIRHLKLEPERHYCVDDAASENYSRIVPSAAAGPGTSGEKMWAEPLYRRGMVIDYPTNRQARAGSCIFLHVWRGAGEGTVGCIATAEEGVGRLQDWVDPAKAVIAILPAAALKRYRNCLPN